MPNIPSAGSLAVCKLSAYEICRNWFMFSFQEVSVTGMS